MSEDLIEQIAAAEAELGVVQEQTSTFKILHSLVNFNFASTTPKPSTSSTTKGQESLEEAADLDLDLQVVKIKAELDRVRLKGEHFRYRREKQRQKSQDNLKKKTHALERKTKRHIKAPDRLTQQIVAITVAITFNEPSRNRFCVDLEIENVHAISNMWWMNRQLDMQLEALDDLNELLNVERTKLQEEAHTNRAQMLMLTEIVPSVDKLEFQLDQENQAELDQQHFEISILEKEQLAPKLPQPPPTPSTITTKPKVTSKIQFSPRFSSPSPTVLAASTA
jgi:hypothetical protein